MIEYMVPATWRGIVEDFDKVPWPDRPANGGPEQRPRPWPLDPPAVEQARVARALRRRLPNADLRDPRPSMMPVMAAPPCQCAVGGIEALDPLGMVALSHASPGPPATRRCPPGWFSADAGCHRRRVQAIRRPSATSRTCSRWRSSSMSALQADVARPTSSMTSTALHAAMASSKTCASAASSDRVARMNLHAAQQHLQLVGVGRTWATECACPSPGPNRSRP